MIVREPHEDMLNAYDKVKGCEFRSAFQKLRCALCVVYIFSSLGSINRTPNHQAAYRILAVLNYW